MVKTIALAGFGLEGRSAYRYLKDKYPEASFTIYNQTLIPKQELPSKVDIKMGDDVDFSDIKADLIVRTPSISPKRFAKNANVTSVTNLFFEACPAPIVGVTGTKGKGTTCSLITSILRATGKTVHLVGNIGEAALNAINDIKSNDIVVYELSSFQLWDMEYSPKIAVVLRVEPDHLDVHRDMDEYVESKSNLVLQQLPSDVVVFHPTSQISSDIAHLSDAKRIRYGVADDGGAYAKMNNFCVQNEIICPVDKLAIPGDHNIENACAAITAALQLTSDYAAIAKGLSNFHGLPHRLKFLRELDGVKYYDDNYSTQPSATIVALRALPQPKILIAGGHDKGVDFTELAEEIKSNGLVKQVLLIGDTAKKIKLALEKAGFYDNEVVNTRELKSIVSRARELAMPGDVVLMSPACASFGLFKNVNDRGTQFVDLVENFD